MRNSIVYAIQDACETGRNPRRMLIRDFSRTTPPNKGDEIRVGSGGSIVITANYTRQTGKGPKTYFADHAFKGVQFVHRDICYPIIVVIASL